MDRQQRTRPLGHPLAATLIAVMALVAAVIAPPGVLAKDPPDRTGREPAFPRAAGVPDAPADGSQKVIVRYKVKPGKADEAKIKLAGGKVRANYRIIDAIAATVPPGAVAKLKKDPHVASVEADGRITAFHHDGDTGDLEYENAWGVEHLGTKTVHDAGITGAGVKVAIIDTGLDYIHYDPTANPPIYNEFLAAYKGGYDFVNGDSDPMDDNGHGTHVAGILAAEKNGYLVAGMAPGVDLYALKVLGATGAGDYSGLIAALQWSVDHDIDVVNISLGGHEVSQALADAVAAASAAGVIIVAAAGNVDLTNIMEIIYGCPVAYPAAYPQVLATTYTNGADELTGYSCTGPQVDFGSPGDNVVSTVPIGTAATCMFCTPYGYAALSGTSMASPHLAGLVALVLDHGIADTNGDGNLTAEIKAHLCANVNPGGRIAVSDPRYPNWYGCGVIDAQKALVTNPPGGGGPPPNQPPVAGDDSTSTPEDAAKVVTVLANDTDGNGDALTVSSVTQPTHGATSTNGTTVTYTPTPNFNGLDGFSYAISDGHGGTDIGAVSVTVTSVNDPPTAGADSVSTAYQTPITISVLVNDSDIDGGTLSVASVTQPVHGSSSTNGSTVTYSPGAGYSGPDAFSYSLADGQGGNATGSVTVSVGAAPANQPPLAGDDAATTAEDTAKVISVLANDSDGDGGTLSVSSVSQPSHGATSTNGTTVTYTPTGNYHGSDGFTYTISDGQGGNDVGAVSVTVTAVNDQPTAGSDSASTPYQTPITIPVLANDTDADGDSLSVAGVGQPGHGSTSTNGTTVIYTPATGYSGPDSFTYSVSDGHGGAATGAVSIVVGPAPPAQVLHVGDLDWTASRQSRSWTAQVTVLVVNPVGAPVSGVTVAAKWTGAAKGTGSCITSAAGTCTIAKSGLGLTKSSITFAVTGATKAGWTYNPGANTDPDSGAQASNGTTITVPRPPA